MSDDSELIDKLINDPAETQKQYSNVKHMANTILSDCRTLAAKLKTVRGKSFWRGEIEATSRSLEQRIAGLIECDGRMTANLAPLQDVAIEERMYLADSLHTVVAVFIPRIFFCIDAAIKREEQHPGGFADAQ
jgi:hypothetical protein